MFIQLKTLEESRSLQSCTGQPAEAQQIHTASLRLAREISRCRCGYLGLSSSETEKCPGLLSAMPREQAHAPNPNGLRNGGLSKASSHKIWSFSHSSCFPASLFRTNYLATNTNVQRSRQQSILKSSISTIIHSLCQ